jgi:hypothetical protein
MIDIYVRRDVPPTEQAPRTARTAREAIERKAETLDMLPDPDKRGGDEGSDSTKEPEADSGAMKAPDAGASSTKEPDAGAGSTKAPDASGP